MINYKNTSTTTLQNHVKMLELEADITREQIEDAEKNGTLDDERLAVLRGLHVNRERIVASIKEELRNRKNNKKAP